MWAFILELSGGRLRRPGKKTHGETKTRLYNIWSGMHKRCRLKGHVHFRYYGGRGIKVCKRWERFENFRDDMGQPPSAKHSLDRINADGNYSPRNCRWATAREQARGRRDARFITYLGEKRHLIDWCLFLDLNFNTISARFRNFGPDPVRLFAPIDYRFSRLSPK